LAKRIELFVTVIDYSGSLALMSARKKPVIRPQMRRDPAIDEYLAGVSSSRRAPLQKLRQAIHSIVPDVEECISYGMPAFRYKGRIIAGFQATSKGCSYYPFSGTTLKTLADDLEDYSKTKSALHLRPDKALPASLVRKLLRARIAEGKGDT
jgi:uncharacterized protein YdhG (YjbR/CyaY superfamily)